MIKKIINDLLEQAEKWIKDREVIKIRENVK